MTLNFSKNDNDRIVRGNTNLHSLYGTRTASDVWREFNYFNFGNETLKKFVSSRSTWATSGHTHHHVLDYNLTTLDDIEYAIAGMVNFNIFGIPSAGPNLCHYSSEIAATFDSVCARWMKFAAFMPFAKQSKDSLFDTSQKEIWKMDESFKI